MKHRTPARALANYYLRHAWLSQCSQTLTFFLLLYSLNSHTLLSQPSSSSFHQIPTKQSQIRASCHFSFPPFIPGAKPERKGNQAGKAKGRNSPSPRRAAPRSACMKCVSKWDVLIFFFKRSSERRRAEVQARGSGLHACGGRRTGEMAERVCLKQMSACSLFPALPSQNKTPTLLFLCSDPSALARALAPSLPVLSLLLWTQAKRRPLQNAASQSETDSVSQLSRAHLHKHTESEREREIEKTCNRMLVWVRGKRVYMNTNTDTRRQGEGLE